MSRFDPLTLKVLGHQTSRDQSLYTKFEPNWGIPGWIIDNLANFCTRYVKSWPWPL